VIAKIYQIASLLDILEDLMYALFMILQKEAEKSMP
jgi:hypothetical protein